MGLDVQMKALDLQYKPLEFQLNVANLKSQVKNNDRSALLATKQVLDGERATAQASLNAIDGSLQASRDALKTLGGFRDAAIRPYKLADDKKTKIFVPEGSQGVVGYAVDTSLVHENDPAYATYDRYANDMSLRMRYQHNLNQVGLEQNQLSDTLKTLLPGAGVGPGDDLWGALELDGSPRIPQGFNVPSAAAAAQGRQNITDCP